MDGSISKTGSGRRDHRLRASSEMREEQRPWARAEFCLLLCVDRDAAMRFSHSSQTKHPPISSPALSPTERAKGTGPSTANEGVGKRRRAKQFAEPNRSAMDSTPLSRSVKASGEVSEIQGFQPVTHYRVVTGTRDRRRAKQKDCALLRGRRGMARQGMTFAVQANAEV